MTIGLTSGKIQKAQRIVIYGPEGIGKSTLANQFPSPVFIDIEGSTNWMDVKRLTCGTWQDILDAVKYLKIEKHGFKTAVFDTADWAERFCVQSLCAKNNHDSIEDFGYGKGYTYLAETFGKLLTSLNALVDAGMNVIFVAHCTVKKMEMPEDAGSYDHYEFKCTRQTSPLLKEWAEAVLFVNYHVTVKQNDQKRSKALGGRKRIIHTQHTAAYDAKNRSDLPDQIPFELPFDFKLLSNILAIKTESNPVPVTPPAKPLDSVLESVQPPIDEAKDKLALLRYQNYAKASEIIKGMESEANAWMLKNGWIIEGGHIGLVSDENIAKILSRPAAFKTAIKATALATAREPKKDK